MKITVEIDCTPLEARSFMGLPNVEPLHEAMLAGIQEKMRDGLKALEPESLLKQWGPIGLQSLEQFQKFLWGGQWGAGSSDPQKGSGGG